MNQTCASRQHPPSGVVEGRSVDPRLRKDLTRLQQEEHISVEPGNTIGGDIMPRSHRTSQRKPAEVGSELPGNGNVYNEEATAEE